MKTPMITLAAALLAAGSFYLLAAEEHHEKRPYAAATPKTATPDSSPEAARYRNECGACHMAYQPALLPKRSWQKGMTGLETHFGTDATLEPTDHRTIAAYLEANAADVRPQGKHMAKIAASLASDAPMQMTRSSYFVRKHRKIPARAVAQPEVNSLANCNACHTKAEIGSYREREINIPNYGRWDD